MRKKLTLGEIVNCFTVNKFRLFCNSNTHTASVLVPVSDISRYRNLEVWVIGFVDRGSAWIGLRSDSFVEFDKLRGN